METFSTITKLLNKEIARLNDRIEAERERAQKAAIEFARFEERTEVNAQEIVNLREGQQDIRSDMNEIHVTLVKRLTWGAVGGTAGAGIIEGLKALFTGTGG